MDRIAEYPDFEARVNYNLLVRLTDTQNTGEPDQTKIETAADDATAFIFSLLGRNYEVPTDPVPPMLVRSCVTIAIWYLGLSNPESGLGEDLEMAYERAVEMLKDIVAGEASLGVDDPQREGERNPVIVSSVDPVFTDDVLRRY